MAYSNVMAVKASMCARESGRKRGKRIFVVSVGLARPNGGPPSAAGSMSAPGATKRASSSLRASPEKRLPHNWQLIPRRWTHGPAHLANQGAHGRQHLDNLRRKDSLSGAETAQISVRLGNYSASHFEGSTGRQRLPRIASQ